MARNDKSDQQFNEALVLGQQNQALLPRLRNWCRHMQIEDCSGGLIHEMYRLPMNLGLSCPHAEGQCTAMNLEWNASMFIEENCVNCAFHAEVFPQNFGREVLARLQQAEQAASLQAQQQAGQRAELQTEINVLLAGEQTQGDMKSLSILTLVQQLGAMDADHTLAAATVLEAARLSPSFFTGAALNYLALHLDTPQAPALLQALRVLVEAGKALPEFSWQRLLAVVEDEELLDPAIGVLGVAVDPTDLTAQADLLRRLVAQLRYERRAMHSRAEEETEVVYPHVVALR